jgi:hypothetical protein
MNRYFFEREEIASETITCNSYYHEDDEVDDYEEHSDREVLAHWAIYDRRCGHFDPIGYAVSVETAEKMVNALNRNV